MLLSSWKYLTIDRDGLIPDGCTGHSPNSRIKSFSCWENAVKRQLCLRCFVLYNQPTIALRKRANLALAPIFQPRLRFAVIFYAHLFRLLHTPTDGL